MIRILGLVIVLVMLPTAAFFLARTARLGNDVKARTAGMIGAAQILVCANQLYGDMGIFSLITMYVLGSSFAMALRLPTVAGVWNTARPKPRPQAA